MLRLSLAAFSVAACASAITIETQSPKFTPSQVPKAQGDDRPKECKALALGGGASKGAFQAGAVYALTQFGNANDFKWDVITGISTGSVNASVFGTFTIGDEKNMGQVAVDTWQALRTADVYEVGAHVKAGKGALLSLDPLSNLLTNLMNKHFKGSYKRKTSLGVVRLEDNEYMTMDLDKLRDPLINVPKAVRASSSFPLAVFTPMMYDGTWYVDGNVKHAFDVP